MPRQRHSTASQEKRSVEADNEGRSPKRTKTTDGDVTVEGQITGGGGGCSRDADNGEMFIVGQNVVVVPQNITDAGDDEFHGKGDHSSGDKEKTELRERSMSNSSSTEQRNRSLEALFQVTDTELQAISKQAPEGHHVIEMKNEDGYSETLYVIDSAIQDREELIEEAEVIGDEEDCVDNVEEESNDDTEESTSNGKKDVSQFGSLQIASPLEADDYTDEPVSEIVDTPKWRQFKNIERILQNAGIDTSSKTWQTLTRPGRHICPYCQRACTKPSVLEKHIRAHTGERPYPCAVCGFAFKTKSNLYKHCKSRAHTLKQNVESKKMRAQMMSSTDSEDVAMATNKDADGFNPDDEKKHMEPAQRHVIQEVVKYLEKDKGQRPNEVQTERQRAKLERLKSMQEKGIGDSRKQHESKGIHRQLSLPVLPTEVYAKGQPGHHFQKIAPKEASVNNFAQLVLPGTVFVNEKGEMIQTMQRMDSVEQIRDKASFNPDQPKASGDMDSPFFNQIEIVNLPNPDTDPETSTKALRDLEELSEKFSAAAQDGLRLSTSVHSLPDKRVQVVLQLQRPVSKIAEMSNESSGSQQSHNQATPRSALKERIQRLISANAAIVDTPKVEPPRAKCVKRNFSRQDSETQTIPRSDTEAAVSGLLMPNISSIPLQPLPLEGESIHQHGDERSSARNIYVEKVEGLNDNILVINNEVIGKEKDYSATKTVATDIETGDSKKSKFIRMDSPGVVFPNRSLSSGKGLRDGLQLSISSVYSQAPLKEQLVQSSQVSHSHKPTSSVIMSPVATVASKNMVPGHIGKMALKNLQMRSKSLSSLNVASSPNTPVVMVTQPALSISGQTSTSYMLQTPTTPVGQVMVQGSGMPLLFLGGTSGTTFQSFTPTIEQRPTVYVQQVVQPGIRPSGSQVVNFIQTPTKSPTSQFTNPVTGQTFIVEQSASDVTQKQAVMTGVHFSQKSLPILGSSISDQSLKLPVQSPLVLTPSQPDPMKILNSIVSNTVKNNPNMDQTSSSQPKEIKIEIKLPPPASVSQRLPLLSSGGVVPPVSTARPRPPLKRQNPVSGMNSPSLPSALPSPSPQSPVFRFKNVSPNILMQSKIAPPTQLSQQRFQIAGTMSADVLTSTTPSTKSPQTSVIKEFLSRGDSFDSKSRGQPDKPLFQCSDCHIHFKKKETLDLHNFCYCKSKNNKNLTHGSSEVKLKSEIQTKIVSKLFSQSPEKMNVPKVSKTVSTDSALKTPAKLLNKNRAESFDIHHSETKKAKFEFPLERSKSVIISPMERKLPQRTETPALVKQLSFQKSQNLKGVETVQEKAIKLESQDSSIKSAAEKVTKPITTKKLKELWQSKLKGQILKRKLKGKLLNRSLSMDQSLVEDLKPSPSTPSKTGLKTRFSDIHDSEGIIPKKRPRLVRSQEDVVTDGITIKRPVFRRSKSVPDLPKLDEEETGEKSGNDEVEKIEKDDDAKAEEKVPNWQLANVSVPIATADCVVNLSSVVKPIYQQNFRMKLFEGMGTPVQLMPSATLTPRPELMEMEKFRKRFTFEPGSLKLIQNANTDSPPESPSKTSSIKIPTQPETDTSSACGSKVTSASSPNKLISPIPSSAPQKSPLVRQFSLVAHTYPSMRSMTHLTFCCAYQLQPSYVKSGKKVSMYSNWRIAQQNNNLLGLPTRALLSLYNSKYSTNPVWVMNSGEDPRSGAITHSSYWKIKNKERNVDTIFSLMEVKEPRREKDKSKFEVGYKTTEEEVYVRGRGRGKYVCETCGIRCKKPSMLKKHIRTHTDLRPYKCKYCQFSFKTKGNLQKHMKSKSHYKVCIDQGISPVPTTVDESQIDEEALQAQCYLSKRAKIYDKSDESSRSLERDVSTTDDNDDDDDDEDYKMADDGDDDNAEGGDENDDIAMETSTQEEFLQHEDKLDQRVAAMQETDVTTTNSQHNTFLQSLGIIAKHRLDDSDQTQISQTGSSTLPLPIAKSLGISLENLHQFGVTSSLSTAGSATDTTTTSSLSTVYGNLKVENEGHPSVTKDSDVIWGLLNLSDQPNKPTADVNVISKKVDNTGTSVEVNSTVKVSDLLEKTSQSSSSSVTSQVKVTQSNSFLPPYLSMAGTMKLKSTKSGPIIGQIIQNVTSKSSTTETSDSRAVTMPFQFQHPFPGSLGVMLTAGSDSKYSTVTSSDLQMTESQPSTIPTPSVSEQKFGTQEELMYIQIGNMQGEIDTIPAQIVNIDPAMFRGKSQDSTPEKPVSLPTENILQLRRVSDGLYVITTDTEIKTGTSVAMETQPGTSISMDTPPGVIVSGSLPNIPSSTVVMPHRAWQLTDSVSHETASGSSHVAGRSSSHVTGSNSSHVTGSNSSHVTGSNSSHVTGSDGARFVCKICKAAFPEHHQLILHGNIHFLDSSRLKCEKCNLKFRSHAAYEKHLLSDQHSAMVQNKLLSPDSDDPRPYKCEPCHTAFRLKGHLTKHFRSRSHFKNFEALGHIPIGFWEKLENNVSEIEASTVEEFLSVINRLKSSRNDASWDQGVIIENENVSENFDGGNDRVLVEVNEEAYEMDAIGDGEKYRAYPLPGVFVAESPKSDSEETEAVVPHESIKVKPHKCGLCGRGFEMVAELKTHLITHAELRPYVCEYCDAGFTNAQSLKIHLYTHTQETPYVCGMCGLKFPNIQDLTNHCKISHPPPGRSLSHVVIATNSSSLSSSSFKSIQPSEVTQTVSPEHVAPKTISQQDVNTSVVVMTTGQSDPALATGQGHPDIVMATPHSASSTEHVYIKSESLDSTDSEKLYAVPVREMVVCGENEEMEETGEMSEIVITGENEDHLQESNIVHTVDDDDDSVYDSNVEYIVGDDDISSDVGEQTDGNVTLSPKVYDYVMEDNSVVVMDQEQEFTSVSPVVSMETGDQSETDDIIVSSVAMETNNTSAISSGYVTYIMSQSLATTSAMNEIPITQYVTMSENMVQSNDNVIYITENVMSTPENVPIDENSALVAESVIQQPDQVIEAIPVSFHSSK